MGNEAEGRASVTGFLESTMENDGMARPNQYAFLLCMSCFLIKFWIVRKIFWPIGRGAQ